MDNAVVDREVDLLQHVVKNFGKRDDAGKFVCTFGELFDTTQDIFEALAGTLKAAKKRNLVAYAAPILLKGAHDKVVIQLLVEPTTPMPAGH
jgi:hypothetical protein